MKKLTTLFATLMVLLLGFTSCKKDKADHELWGEWREKELTGLSRRINFNANNSFFMAVTTESAPNISTALIGTYTLQGDVLKVTITEKLVYEVGKPDQKSPDQTKLFENATFSIKDNVLTLNYTTYPADAPVATVAKYERAQRID